MNLNEHIPAKLERLPDLAYNLWWSWSPEARALFRRLDYTLWKSTQHNPVKMLQLISPEKLREASADAAFVRQYNKVILSLDRQVRSGRSWFHEKYPELRGRTIAYFSFEFGLHNSLPIYSGGLGILSGDHAKEASDLGLPFVGVGFMYPQGYFRQNLPSHGWQEAFYQQLDMDLAPVRVVMTDEGQELKVSVAMGDRTVWARVWHVQVGRTPLYLLDTDVDENDPWDRELSARLYSGDAETRIRQEIMLGIGGVRALRLMGIQPAVWHLNEGHSAFLVLERLRELVAAGHAFDDAAEQVRAQTVFTTHTPVPAGHDAFAFHLIEQYFGAYWEELGINRDRFLALGEHQEEWGNAFNMTVLALRMSGMSNGVSELHGRVSRQMWQEVWNERAAAGVPIGHITNGVHLPTWIAGEMFHLFSRYLEPEWLAVHDDPRVWRKLDDLPARELWGTHQVLKRKLIGLLRERARERWVDGRNDPTQILTNGTLLDPEALTIGFARRFATYKRATLIFSDMERLQRLILNTHRPVQIIFAGKAHPADDPGKMLIQTIYNMAKNNQLGGRIAFVEDYDMHTARYLTQGVDLWLNTPRRPREASGTSGMKAALNGVPNLSILDGWWAEGYNGANGWAIGQAEKAASLEEQDWSDANSLYQLLEEEIVPLFYSRDRDDIPRGWTEIMRESIMSNAPRYSTRRMVKAYTENYYLPAMKGVATLA